MELLTKMRPYAEKAIQWRRDIHAHPETGFDLPRTSALVASQLESFGLEVHSGFVPGAVMGILKTGRPGATVAVRADMDALGIQDEKTVDYRSQNDGKCHACGHDAHTAVLLALANYCADHRDELCGTVKFVFQPAEEGPAPGGAKLICDSGMLEDVDYMIGAHAQPLYRAGQVGMRHDEAFASGDFFEITLTGTASHAASPHLGKDVITTAAEIIQALQTIRSRELPPLRPGVVSVTSVNAGMLAVKNALPQTLTFGGTYRTYDPELRELMSRRIREISEEISKLHQCACEVKIQEMFPPLTNNNEVIDVVHEAAVEQLGEENVFWKPLPEMGSEDFAYYTHKTKAGFFFFGVRNEEKECTYSLHNPKFNLDEDTFAPTLAVFAASLSRLLRK